MSWVPGDFSAIHDHGAAQWGAVKSFGEAEHAVFIQQNGTLRTCSRQSCSRQSFPEGSVFPVSHDFIHQMWMPQRFAPCTCMEPTTTRLQLRLMPVFLTFGKSASSTPTEGSFFACLHPKSLIAGTAFRLIIQHSCAITRRCSRESFGCYHMPATRKNTTKKPTGSSLSWSFYWRGFPRKRHIFWPVKVRASRERLGSCC